MNRSNAAINWQLQYTLKDAARISAESQKTMMRAEKRGLIKFNRKSRKILISLPELLRYTEISEKDFSKIAAFISAANSEVSK